MHIYMREARVDLKPDVTSETELRGRISLVGEEAGKAGKALDIGSRALTLWWFAACFV